MANEKNLFFIGPTANPFYINGDKCGKLGQNPSAKNCLVHFLLGAMLRCSTPFCTSECRPQALCWTNVEPSSPQLKIQYSDGKGARNDTALR